jgi:hypothetical protein
LTVDFGLGLEVGHGGGVVFGRTVAVRALAPPVFRSPLALCSVVLPAVFGCPPLVPALGSAGASDTSDGLLPNPVGELLPVPVGVGVGGGLVGGEVDVGAGDGVLEEVGVLVGAGELVMLMGGVRLVLAQAVELVAPAVGPGKIDWLLDPGCVSVWPPGPVLPPAGWCGPEVRSDDEDPATGEMTWGTSTAM